MTPLRLVLCAALALAFAPPATVATASTRPPPAGSDQGAHAATVVGPSRVAGVECDHYAFRQDNADWQIWIQKGDRPVPRKMVISDRLQPSHPQFEATLDWNLSPRLTGDTFTFPREEGVMPIRLTSLKPLGGLVWAPVLVD